MGRPSTGQIRLQTFREVLRLFPTGRLADLGTGHGAFAVLAADAGWQVTGVDARAERFPDDPRVTWLLQDVRDLDVSGFDVVSCLGFYYHLTLDDQMDLLKRCSGRPIVIDTHVDAGTHTHRLSGRENIDGYEGRWYAEPGGLRSSWTNPRSFWPTPATLRRQLRENGYGLLLAVEPWYLPDRTFFIAHPGGGS